MNDTITIRSSLSSEVLKKALFRGSLIAFVGLFILLYVGITLYPQDLSYIGFPTMFVSFGLMSWGMYPYRNLSRMQLHPHKFQMDETLLNYSKGDKISLKIPLDSIKEMGYHEQGNHYGLAIHLKEPLPEKLCVLDPKLDMHRLRRDSLRKFSCDLFFPYFTEHAVKKIAD